MKEESSVLDLVLESMEELQLVSLLHLVCMGLIVLCILII